MSSHLFSPFSRVGLAGVATLLVAGGWFLAPMASPQAQAAPITIDTSDQQAVTDAYLNTYLPALAVPVDWNGDIATCTAGEPSAAAKQAMLDTINFVRAMAGLDPVTEDVAISQTYTQQAALMMEANGEMSHSRPSTWDCWSAQGGQNFPTGNGGEIIAQAGDASAIPMYLLDDGASNKTMGHRASVLAPWTSQVGIGSTTNYNAIHVLGDSSLPPVASSYSWPTKGYFPSQLLAQSATRWSYYPQCGDASGATVTVTKNGEAIPVTTYPVQYRLAQTDGVGWDMPTPGTPAAGTTDTYQVKVTGIADTGGCATTSDSYTVDVYQVSQVTIDSVDLASDNLASSSTIAVGQPVTAVAEGLDPADADLSCQWTRSFQPIDGATDCTYTPVAADADTFLGVQVTAQADGYAPATVTSYSRPLGGQPQTRAGVPALGATTAAVGSPVTVTVTNVPAQDSAAFPQDPADPAAWTQTYQWKLDGVAIDGATGATYTPTAADAGGALSVDVTMTSRGDLPVTVSLAQPVTVQPAPLKPGTVTITGTPQVGQTVTALPGTWDPASASLGYQWLLDGVAIDGATGATYTLVPADAGHALTVRVTGTLTGYTSANATSAPVTVQPAPMTPGTVTITGTPQVGQQLQAVVAGWPTTALTYQWYADGVALTGATAATYIPSMTDQGTAITVVVTGTKQGYLPATATSAATAAVQAPPPPPQGQGQVLVSYVDDDASGAVVATGQTLTGLVGDPVGFTQQMAAAGVPAGYDLGSIDDVPAFAAASQTIRVHLTHHHTVTTEQTTRTIRYSGAGDLTPAELVQTIVWTIDTDQVTGEATTTSEGGYPAVTSPLVAGYIPAPAMVPAIDPSALTPQQGAILFEVAYTAVQPIDPGTNPGEDQPGGDQPGGDQPGTNPGGDQPGTNPGGDQPGGDQPGTNPGGDQPGTNPGGDQPGGDQPGTNPGGDQPGTNPGEDQPGGDQPGGDQPGTNPGGDQPGGDQPPAGSGTTEPPAGTSTSGPTGSKTVTVASSGVTIETGGSAVGPVAPLALLGFALLAGGLAMVAVRRAR